MNTTAVPPPPSDRWTSDAWRRWYTSETAAKMRARQHDLDLETVEHFITHYERTDAYGIRAGSHLTPDDRRRLVARFAAALGVAARVTSARTVAKGRRARAARGVGQAVAGAR